jgi:DNA primase
MSFFEYYFSDSAFEKRETAVCCPFPHFTTNGHSYLESEPSAHINLDKNLFHCKVCQKGLSEPGFIKEVLNCSYEDALRIKQLFERNTEDKSDWVQYGNLPEDIKEQILNLGISENVIEELNIQSETGTDIGFPVFMFDKLLDVRQYRPNSKPKIKSRVGTIAGLIIPYDIWRNSKKEQWTLICAGEKDMAVARSHNFNAITLTGGESVSPINLAEFKDRKVAIVYDNDKPGLAGANKLAQTLYTIAEQVRVVTKFHEDLEEKEDITDYFTKYSKTREDLIECIKNTENFTEKDFQEVKETKYPTVTLLEATEPKYVNKLVRSNVQVVATFESSFMCPSNITGTKISHHGGEENNSMMVGEKKEWTLTPQTMQDMLHLIDSNFTEKKIKDNIRDLLRIPKKEHSIKIQKNSKITAFKCVVTDLFESNADKVVPIEFTAYSIGKKLESGKKYKITFKLVPHPYSGQQLTMLISDVEQATDSVSNFKITEEVKANLNEIRSLQGSVKERVEQLTERVKGMLGYDGNNKLIQAIDLSYHTVLKFDFGRFKNERGYLDTFIVGESRVGKSSTALALQEMYDLGTFTSLAGNSATVAGLIGGSNKVGGGYQTRAGLIPQNHTGLLIFEEFSKCNSNIIKELTDIRSSNEVRITRVSGTLNLPAMVRMITLTNVKTKGTAIRPISSYPNGIEIITELIGSAEDIARYDLMLVLDYKANNETDPFWEPEEPFSKEIYKTKIRWVWSRKPEQILISDTVGHYIVKKCNELNKKYNSHIKIFGTELWKKIIRLSIACAGYLVSTDESFENLIINKEHVDFAIDYFISLYDNDTFKYKEYVDQERRYSEVTQENVDTLQEMYISSPSLLLQLERTSSSTRNSLTAATGLTNDEFNKATNRLVRNLFVRFEGHDIVPTEKFRKAMSKIDRKNSEVKKAGEFYDQL